MDTPYIVGIDLGTTNCAVAFTAPSQGADAPVVDFAMPQMRRPGEVIAQTLLPSCLYIAGEHELPPGSMQLPWGDSPKTIAGEFAPLAGRPSSRTLGGVGEKLALPFRRGPIRADSALGRPIGHSKDFACGRLLLDALAHRGGVESSISRHPVAGSGNGYHCARVVRRSSASADNRSGAPGWLVQFDARRRAPSGVLTISRRNIATRLPRRWTEHSWYWWWM